MIKISYYFSILVKKAREQNVYAGITISVLITVISYLLISIISILLELETLIYSGFFLFADLEYAVGTIFGVLFFLKNRRPDQSILKYGVITGIIGGILSSLFISLYQWILLFYFYHFLEYLIYTLLSGVFIGLLIGALLCAYFMYKEVKEEGTEEYFGEDFFKDLVDD